MHHCDAELHHYIKVSDYKYISLNISKLLSTTIKCPIIHPPNTGEDKPSNSLEIHQQLFGGGLFMPGLFFLL